MNKQIIIDGVDVSGCEFYCEYDCSCREINGKYDTDICDFDNCYNRTCFYKNLKRKEQVIEEIKEIAKTCLKLESCWLCNHRNECYIDDGYMPENNICNFILQKISEYEVEND